MKLLDWLKFKGNKFDIYLARAKKNNHRTFLIPWNRGLGDIALGLYVFVCRIRTFIPDAQITFITRKELEDGFRLIGGVSVIGVSWWQRGVPIELHRTLERLNIPAEAFDEIMDKANPTRWLSWQIGKVVPRLQWNSEYDNLCERFNLGEGRRYIGVHVSSETAQFYGYQKDWPTDCWKTLFMQLAGRKDCNIILFGNTKNNEFSSAGILDLRGETGLLEMLSIIKNRCSVLIAPDGGVLSIAYYLDTYFPIKVISLWGDAGQGVLKQNVPSPNKGLMHRPLKGDNGVISNISVDAVIAEI
jgi:ADP-heptose:LPS heptosyltransferase